MLFIIAKMEVNSKIFPFAHFFSLIQHIYFCYSCCYRSRVHPTIPVPVRDCKIGLRSHLRISVLWPKFTGIQTELTPQ